MATRMMGQKANQRLVEEANAALRLGARLIPPIGSEFVMTAGAGLIKPLKTTHSFKRYLKWVQWYGYLEYHITKLPRNAPPLDQWETY